MALVASSMRAQRSDTMAGHLHNTRFLQGIGRNLGVSCLQTCLLQEQVVDAVAELLTFKPHGAISNMSLSMNRVRIMRSSQP